MEGLVFLSADMQRISTEQQHASRLITMRHPNDEDLMAAIRTKACEQAFEDILDRYSDRAFRMASGLLGAHQVAEDAVQETFLRLLRSRASFRPGLKFAPWFFTLLRNICLDEHRRKARRPLLNLEELPTRTKIIQTTDAEVLLKREQCQLATEAMSELSERDREILCLRIYAELDFAEIGELVGLKTEAAKKRAYRALTKIRKMIEQTL
jgi:RNA polymerase sigma-70 factor, ECF subfamily